MSLREACLLGLHSGIGQIPTILEYRKSISSTFEPRLRIHECHANCCQLLVSRCALLRFFSTSNSKGLPIDTFVIAGGRLVRRATLLKRPLRSFEGFDVFLRDDLLLDLSLIRVINLSGYSLRSHGRDTMRQALMIVMLDSSIVHTAAGTI